LALEYEGAKWGDGALGTTGGVVTYAFASQSSPTYYSYTGQLDATYQAVIVTAFAVWSSYADIEFVLTTDVANADICIGWDSMDGIGGSLAECTYWFSGGEMRSAEIRFDTAEAWVPTNEQASTFNYSFEAVAIHEIGHAIGLDHSSSTASIMYPTYGAVMMPAATDISTVQQIYGAATADYTVGWGATRDLGGWTFGWHTSGMSAFGWHYETGWEYGWYSWAAGAWGYGWYFFNGLELGWHEYGSWDYGWYFDAGGAGRGLNEGSASGGYYANEDGSASAPVFPSGYGSSYDFGGWTHGWHTAGWSAYGWHYESGWDYGWYSVSAWSWTIGWFLHAGWEYGWHEYGSWSIGWYYDSGGSGFGWMSGAAQGSHTAAEDGGWYDPTGMGPSYDIGTASFGWHTAGWLSFGWHYESGWDYGWYSWAPGAWHYGWYQHVGWENGWHEVGAWTYGWYYDYGGAGIGWNSGSAWGTYGGSEAGY